MTNYEYYYKELVRAADLQNLLESDGLSKENIRLAIEDSFALSRDCEIIPCAAVECLDCQFHVYGLDCEPLVKLWLDRPYIEELHNKYEYWEKTYN